MYNSSHQYTRHFMSSSECASSVLLPFALDELIDSWNRLRFDMSREIPSAFRREEWAYLIQFLDPHNLWEPFRLSFGAPVDEDLNIANRVYSGRGLVGIWLPNNVSLLGPLLLVLLSLTGNPQCFKAGSRSENLVQVFLDFALSHLPNGALHDYLSRQVEVVTFGRDDPRGQELAKKAAVRIVFGSDQSAARIHALGGAMASHGFSFIDRQSQVWLTPESLSDDTLVSVAKVFAIYGRAGCTSPRRVVIIDGHVDAAHSVRDRIIDLWPTALRAKPEVHVASANVMCKQMAAALGWDGVLTQSHSAVIAAGLADTPEPDGNLFLPVVSLPLEAAARALPTNIQTLGVAARRSTVLSRWIRHLPRSVCRVVPVAQMHHFGPIWDGEEYWRACFTCAMYESDGAHDRRDPHLQTMEWD